MNAYTVAPTDGVRRQMIDMLTAQGVPAAEARETADVAIHAAEEAYRAVARVCEPMRGRSWTNTYQLALSAASALFAARQGQLQELASELIKLRPSAPLRSVQ